MLDINSIYRNTYVEIDLKNIEHNVKTLIHTYPDYQYYFGVVKADSYGHDSIQVVKSIIHGGCNYLAVATLEEALEIRKEIKNIPILCLGIIAPRCIDICIQNHIAITISNYLYLQEILSLPHQGLKVHIKINTGMNRLGIKSKEELNTVYQEIQNSHLLLEGIYTHIYSPLEASCTKQQFSVFENLTADIPLSKIPIVHLGASDATMQFEKRPYSNGCRLGIAMYGLMDSPNVNLLPTFRLYSEVIQINDVENETIGYNGAYLAKGKEKIAIVPIGYADGIIRKNTGRNVYIHDKPYPIVGNICMDMLFVKVDDTVSVGDQVMIIKDIKHIKQIAKHLDTIPYEILCTISKRVPRIYQ